MDFLNNSLAQLKDLFLSMTPASRITSGLLVAVVVVSLGYLFTHEITGPEVYLLSGETFSNSELASMEEAFGQDGLGSYEIAGRRIRVPHSQRSDYMAALARHGAMPEAFGDIITRALEAGSVLTSPNDRQAYLKNAREVQLAQTVSALKEIEAATVMYDTETKPGLMREKVYSASVTVEPVGSRPLDSALASSIRLLVAGAIAGLEPKDVAITDRNTGHTTYGDSQNFSSPHDDPYFARKICYEQEYTDSILSALRGIHGLTVTTHVELDTEQMRQEEEIKRDAQPAAASSEEAAALSTTASGALAGLIGFKSQGNAPRSLASMASTRVRQRRQEADGMISTVITKTKKAGYTPKRVSVAVTVPTSYFESVWRQNAVRQGQEPQRSQESDLAPIRTKTFAEIEKVVGAIIGQPDGVTDPSGLVTVAEFPDIIPPEIPKPGLGRHVLAWLASYWRGLGLIALGAVGLVMLRSIIHKTPGLEAHGRPAGRGEEEGTPREGVSERPLRPFPASGESLQRELSEVVADDPDSAAGILRNWIGNAT